MESKLSADSRSSWPTTYVEYYDFLGIGPVTTSTSQSQDLSSPSTCADLADIHQFILPTDTVESSFVVALPTPGGNASVGLPSTIPSSVLNYLTSFPSVTAQLGGIPIGSCSPISTTCWSAQPTSCPVSCTPYPGPSPATEVTSVFTTTWPQSVSTSTSYSWNQPSYKYITIDASTAVITATASFTTGTGGDGASLTACFSACPTILTPKLKRWRDVLGLDPFYPHRRPNQKEKARKRQASGSGGPIPVSSPTLTSTGIVATGSASSTDTWISITTASVLVRSVTGDTSIAGNPFPDATSSSPTLSQTPAALSVAEISPGSATPSASPPSSGNANPPSGTVSSGEVAPSANAPPASTATSTVTNDAVVTGSSTTITASQVGSGTFALGTITITQGQTATLPNGQAVSVNSGGNLVGTIVVSNAAASTTTVTNGAVIAGSSTTITALQVGSGTFALGTTTIVQGQTATLPNGQTVSVNSAGSLVGGSGATASSGIGSYIISGINPGGPRATTTGGTTPLAATGAAVAAHKSRSLGLPYGLALAALVLW